MVNTQPASSLYTWQDSSATGWVNLVNNTFLVAVNDTLFVNNISYTYNNRKFRCIVDSAGAGLKKDTSALVKLFVYPVLPKPTINSDQSICYNTAADTIRVINLPADGLGWYTYQWQIYSDSINFSIITNPNVDSVNRFSVNGQNSTNLKLPKLLQKIDNQSLHYWAKLILGG